MLIYESTHSFQGEEYRYSVPENDKSGLETSILHRWCLHLIVMVGFECPWDPESYAGGSIATGRVTHAGQVKG
jgi:hypothetical protein